MKYVTVHFDVLQQFELSIAEYFLLEAVRLFSVENQSCDKSLNYLQEVFKSKFSIATLKRASATLKSRGLLLGKKTKTVSKDWINAIKSAQNWYQNDTEFGIKMIPNSNKRYQNDTDIGIKMIPHINNNSSLEKNKKEISKTPESRRPAHISKAEGMEIYFYEDVQGQMMLQGILLNPIIAKKRLTKERIVQELLKFFTHFQDTANYMQQAVNSSFLRREFEKWLARDLCKPEGESRKGKAVAQLSNEQRFTQLDQLPAVYSNENFKTLRDLMSNSGALKFVELLKQGYSKQAFYSGLLSKVQTHSSSFEADTRKKYFYQSEAYLRSIQ